MCIRDRHYIRAQWNRGNMPGKDSWQPALPPDSKLKLDEVSKELSKKIIEYRKELNSATGASIDAWRIKLAQVEAQVDDKNVDAEKYGYQSIKIPFGPDEIYD